jgi:hypothetical protein
MRQRRRLSSRGVPGRYISGYIGGKIRRMMLSSITLRPNDKD